MKSPIHLVLYAACWIAIALGLRQYQLLRGKKGLPLVYWMILGLLALLQLYGETWRR